LGVAVATCRIGDLLTAPSAGTMTADSLLARSAAVGSKAVHIGTIHVDNTGRGTLTWTARVGGHSTWLSVENATGQSKVDSVRVRLDPAGLDTGLYRDSVLLSSDVGGSAVVQVRWRIDTCSVTPILASGDQRADTLTSFDCGAPHRPGMQAKLYSFNGTNGEIKTILVVAQFNAHLTLDSVPTGAAAPIDSAADCLGDTKDPCLYYVTLRRTAPYYIEVSTATQNDSGPFTLRLLNGGRNPNPPDSLGQWLDSLTPLQSAATIHQDSVLFRAVVSDSDLVDSVSLEAEVQPIGACFTNNAQFSGPFVQNGHAAWVAAGSPVLHDATAYHWQVRALDATSRRGPWVSFDGDRCSAAADFSIQVNRPPQAPTALAQYQSDGASFIPQGDTAITPSVVFKATATDPDSGLVRLEVEVQPLNNNFTGQANGFGNPVASGGTASATVSSLPNGRYHWRAQVVDNSGAANDSSGWAPYPGTLPDTGADFVVHLPPAHLVLSTQPAVDTAGRLIHPNVVVTVQDQNNQTVTDFAGPVTMTIHNNPGGGTLSGTLTVNAAAGVATFANLSIDKAGTGYTIQASILSGTIVSPASNSFNVVAGPAKQLVFLTPPAGSTAGRAIVPAIQVAAADSFGNPTTFGGNVTLTLAANPAGAKLFGDTSHNAVGGVATFANAILKTASPGYTLRAYSLTNPGLTPDTSGSFTVVPAPASQLVFGPQPGNTVAGAAINNPTGVGVTARDSLGNTATSFAGSVIMTVASGPGVFTPTSTITVPAVAGVAPFANLHIQKVGVGYTLRATAGALTSPASNPFAITVGGLAQLGFVVQPTQTADSAAITPAVQVAGQDSVGNTVIGFSGTVIMSLWNSGANPGGGTLSGTLQAAAAPATGIATFSNLRVNQLGTGYSLLAGSINVQGDTSASFSIVVGPAARLAITLQPSLNAQSGVPFLQQPVIQVVDAAGNPVSQGGVPVTATVASGPGGAFLSSQTATTNAAGTATFGGLAINGLVGSYTLRFGATGLTAATSGMINLSAGPASRLAFGQQPTSSTGGVTITPAVTVRILDAAGNQTSVNNSVTLAIGAGTGTFGAHLSGGASTPAVGGVTTFNGLSIDSAGTGYTLRASALGLTGVTSNAFDVAVGAAAQLAFLQPPSTTAAAVVMTPFVTVAVLDAGGNLVTAAGDLVTLTLNFNPFALTGGGPVAPVNGVAVFSGLSVSIPATGYTLTASASGLSGTTSGAFDITP
jgi:hypothetical protein